jgi:hypothetical protein
MGPILNYRTNNRRRHRPLAKAAALVLVLIGLFLLYSKYSTIRFDIDYAMRQRDCEICEHPPKIVYRVGVSGKGGVSAGTYLQPSPLPEDVGSVASATTSLEWTRFWAIYQSASTERYGTDPPTGISIYLHQRAGPDRRRYLVYVGVAARDNGRVQLDCLYLGIKKFFGEPDKMLWGDSPWLRLYDGKPVPILFYSGRTNPDNQSKFAFNYLAGDETGEVEGELMYLNDGDGIARLHVHLHALSGPAIVEAEGENR